MADTPMTPTPGLRVKALIDDEGDSFVIVDADDGKYQYAHDKAVADAGYINHLLEVAERPLPDLLLQYSPEEDMLYLLSGERTQLNEDELEKSVAYINRLLQEKEETRLNQLGARVEAALNPEPLRVRAMNYQAGWNQSDWALSFGTYKTKETAEQAALYINALIEADQKTAPTKVSAPVKLSDGQPSPDMRLEFVDMGVVLAVAYEDDGVKLTEAGEKQAKIDAAYINWLIETDTRRRAAQAQNMVGTSDVLIDLGDMRHADISKVAIMSEDFEGMTEDYLENFNHIVTQGITPVTALYSFAMAFTIALGACLRANLSDTQSDALLAIVRNNAKTEARRIKVITKQ